MSAPLPTLPAGPSADSCCPAGARPRRARWTPSASREIAGALAEPVRVNILDVLRRSPVEVCQCELVPLFEMPQSTLSHHLKKLADAGLVTVERRHRWAYYSLAPQHLPGADRMAELTTPEPVPRERRHPRRSCARSTRPPPARPPTPTTTLAVGAGRACSARRSTTTRDARGRRSRRSRPRWGAASRPRWPTCTRARRCSTWARAPARTCSSAPGGSVRRAGPSAST